MRHNVLMRKRLYMMIMNVSDNLWGPTVNGLIDISWNLKLKIWNCKSHNFGNPNFFKLKFLAFYTTLTYNMQDNLVENCYWQSCLLWFISSANFFTESKQARSNSLHSMFLLAVSRTISALALAHFSISLHAMMILPPGNNRWYIITLKQQQQQQQKASPTMISTKTKTSIWKRNKNHLKPFHNFLLLS